MDQAELAMPCAEPTPEDPVAFQIGWDHAQHGLVPPADLLFKGSAVDQGWRAARAVLGGRTWAAHRCTRQWLALRMEAWRSGVPFELQTVTPNFLAQIEVIRCPVMRWPLGGATGAPTAARITRINPQAAYAAGNLVVLSDAADRAWRGLGVHELVHRARAAAAAQCLASNAAAMEATQSVGPEGSEHAAPEPDSAAWWRLATLRSLATPLSPTDAVRMPLAVTPPNRARLLNPVQALQALLTARLATPQWAAHMAAVAERLQVHAQRIDFNLWVGALAPRVLEAQALGRHLGLALEDAWRSERALRRWQQFASGLDTLGVAQLAAGLAGRQPGGRTALDLSTTQATEGWALLATVHRTALPLHLPSAPSAIKNRAAAPRLAVGAPRSGLRRTDRGSWSPRPRVKAAPQGAAM